MLIGGTISTPRARSWVKNSHRARTWGASVRKAFSTHLGDNVRLRRAADGDTDHRQMRIMAIVSASDLDERKMAFADVKACWSLNQLPVAARSAVYGGFQLFNRANVGGLLTALNANQRCLADMGGGG